MITYSVCFLFFIGCTLIILDIKYKNKSKSDVNIPRYKKVIDFFIILFIVILIYLIYKTIFLFLLRILIPISERSLYGY